MHLNKPTVGSDAQLGDLVLVCGQSWPVGLSMQDCESAYRAVTISYTLVNRQTHIQMLSSLLCMTFHFVIGPSFFLVKKQQLARV